MIEPLQLFDGAAESKLVFDPGLDRRRIERLGDVFNSSCFEAFGLCGHRVQRRHKNHRQLFALLIKLKLPTEFKTIDIGQGGFENHQINRVFPQLFENIGSSLCRHNMILIFQSTNQRNRAEQVGIRYQNTLFTV